MHAPGLGSYLDSCLFIIMRAGKQQMSSGRGANAMADERTKDHHKVFSLGLLFGRFQILNASA